MRCDYTFVYYGRAAFANVPRTLAFVLTAAQELRLAALQATFGASASAFEAILALARWGMNATPYELAGPLH